MNATYRALALATITACGLPWGAALAQAPKVGPNVNMVSGTRFPEGDPFLTKQNEPSLAVSSRNPRHLLAASNDYRQVQVLIAEGQKGGKAWNTLYKSVDGGTTWRSVVLGGCPLNIDACKDDFTGLAGADGKPTPGTGLTSALRALAPDFSADPTVRAGPHGTFFYSFIAGRRDGSSDGVVAVQRFVDKNNDIQRDTDVRRIAVPGDPDPTPKDVLFHAEDPILPDKLNLLDRGTTGQFIDKPWNAADIGGRPWNTGTCELLPWTKNRTDLRSAAETVPAFSVYVSYALFPGQGSNDHPNVFVAASNDCGNTFSKPVKLSNSLDATSGTSMAIDPLTGTVYVVWRRFGSLESPRKPDEIYINKSSDGGRTWLNQAVRVATIVPYDVSSVVELGTTVRTTGSFRTNAFPSVAVSVDAQGTSRVHVAFTSRKAAADAQSPYACQSANPKDCDSRVMLTTSRDGGLTWSTSAEVDPIPSVPVSTTDPTLAANPAGRGHQWQPALSFAAGKLAITWLDQRFDQTEEVLNCPDGIAANCTRRRVAKGNLDPNCSVDVSAPEFAQLAGSPLLPLLGPSPGACYEYRSGRPASVWTTYMTDGWPGLVRRHTIDVFAAFADPADTPVFASAPVSQYLFGSTVANRNPAQGNFEIRQKEVFAPNLPLFVGGIAAFIGDYIDIGGQTIVAADDAAQRYKFNIGARCPSAECTKSTTAGASPAFHVAFTDNRDVIPPADGDWTRTTCLASEFTGDPANPVTPFGSCTTPGFAGNRNQNVRSAVIVPDSAAYAYANSKLLSSTAPRGFVVTIDNFSSSVSRDYKLTVVKPSSVTASFDKLYFGPPVDPSELVTDLTVQVQPRSSSTRSLWVISSAPNARLAVSITSPPGCGGIGGPACTFSAEVPLNPDPGATQSLVGNGDGASIDIANNDLGGVVLSNAVLTNNVLSNNALSNGTPETAALSNNALTNAALSNVVLSNAALSNLQVENLNPATNPDAAALSNAVLTNAALSNVVLTNGVLSNSVLSNNALSNAVLSNETEAAAALSNAVLSNLALTNLALSNLNPANLALSNAVLSNNVLSNVALSNNALSNVVLTNAVLSNAALSNVALSNAALSNAVLSNNALSNAVLSNRALSNNAPGEDDLDPIEAANFDLSKNAFTSADVAASRFADATFTVRNRGNTDTTLAVKLLLKDAVCTGTACEIPGGIKLQLVMRKIVTAPTAIPPTDPALDATVPGGRRDLRIGLAQFNAQVSNVGTPEIVSVDAPDLGAFLPTKADAATLPLAPGERAHVTLRAIGPNGVVDPFEFLRWGSKFVVVDAAQATRTAIPLIIKTLSLPNATALQATDFVIRTAGGFGSLSGSALCADRFGSTGAGVSPCPASLSIGFASGSRDGVLSFRSDVKGDFYALVRITDQSVPPQEDVQLLKITVVGATQSIQPPLASLLPPFPPGLPFGTSLSLAATTRDGSPIVFGIVGGPCRIDATGTPALLVPTGVGTCTVSATVNGNATFDTLVVSGSVTVVKGIQTISFGPLAAQTWGTTPIAVSASASSGLSVAFASTTPAVCSVTGNLVTLLASGTCTLLASQAGDANWDPAAPASASFVIASATQTIVFAPLPNRALGDSPFVLVANATSALPVVFSSQTPAVCSVLVNTVTLLSSGVCTIAANQPGSPQYAPAAPVLQSFTVQATQTISFAAITGDRWVGDSFAVSATATSGLPVTITSLTTTVCTVSGGTVSLVTIGSCTLAADQPGNAAFSAAPRVPQTFRVGGFLNVGPMVQARRDHTATLLADGRVLLAGGLNASGASTDTSEIYTPATGRFTAAGNLPSKSAGHTATLLPDGRVLAAGGGNSSTEIFSPATNTWSPSGGLGSTRSYHTATLLPDGRVLLAGGADNANKTIQSTIVFNPANGTFANGPAMTTARERHAAILLPSGKVLISGGRQKSGPGYTLLATAELCDATSCTAAGGMSVARWGHAAMQVGNQFLLIGGADTAASADVYNGTAFGTVAMQAVRRDAGAASTADGRVLVTGGSAANALQTSELSAAPAAPFTTGPRLLAPHVGHRATRLNDGRVLVTGGAGAAGVPTAAAELFVGAGSAGP